MKTHTATPISSSALASLFTRVWLASLLIVSVLAPAHAANTFENTGSLATLATARYNNTATLLPNGKVLIAGT